jgi:phosphoenolpyruvate carboxykinase (ATP)
MATQTTPRADRASTERAQSLSDQGLTPSGTVHWNLVTPQLVQAAVRRGEGELADMGPFVAVTAPHTGRSPNDKFVVEEPSSQNDIWWG